MKNKNSINKDITFIYMDSAEKAIFTPIYKEAKRRGYKVKMTDNKFQKCEIGFYCQHVNFPQYSKFSLIMLHDIIQQYGNWPDIWFREPWNKYDIGILPGTLWVNNWQQCSQWYYARPKKGMYKVGWPKADNILKFKDNKYRKNFYDRYNMDASKKTILYAPAWENNNKQDDFVKAMQKLDVNILIKQYDANSKLFPEQSANIKAMAKLHKNIPNVTILPTNMNIFEAIAASDVLVSEESSTMCEAVMMGIPAVSVSNWLIPDVTPSRYPACNYKFVIHTMKENLTECVYDILNNYNQYKSKAIEFSMQNFENIGHTASMIMDIIDDYIDGKKVRYIAIKPNKNKRLSLRKQLNFYEKQLRRQIPENYVKRYKLIAIIWAFFRFLYQPVKLFRKY